MRRAVWIERMKGGMQNSKKERQRTKLCSPTIHTQTQTATNETVQRAIIQCKRTNFSVRSKKNLIWIRWGAGDECK